MEQISLIQEKVSNCLIPFRVEKPKSSHVGQFSFYTKRQICLRDRQQRWWWRWWRGANRLKNSITQLKNSINYLQGWNHFIIINQPVSIHSTMLQIYPGCIIEEKITYSRNNMNIGGREKWGGTKVANLTLCAQQSCSKHHHRCHHRHHNPDN